MFNFYHISFLYVKCCIETNFCDADSMPIGEYDWPESQAGHTVDLPCIGEEGIEVTRMCSLTGNWQDVNFNSCPIFCGATKTGDYDWPRTEAGKSSSQACELGPSSESEYATRQCDSKGNWLDVDNTVCLYANLRIRIVSCW